MGIKKKQRKPRGKFFTQEELAALIYLWLDEHEADMITDYRPAEPLWRKLLATMLAEDIYKI